jgi:hypothetical protein
LGAEVGCGGQAEVEFDVPGEDGPFYLEEEDYLGEGDEAAGEEEGGLLVGW